VVKSQLGHPDPVYRDQARVNVKYHKKLMELEDVITVGKQSAVQDHVMLPDLSYAIESSTSPKHLAIMNQEQITIDSLFTN
jgi:hypothetical protein